MFWNGSTAMEGLSGSARGCAVSVGVFVAAKAWADAHAPSPHRLGDILESLSAHIL